MIQNRVRLLGGLIILAGAWGGIVPFAGPLFGYPMPPGGTLPAWQWSASHLELHLLPAIAVIIGGAGVLASRRHAAAVASAALALLGGAWFVLAPSVSTAWLTRGGGGGGASTNPSTFMSVITPLGYHYGTGLLIAVLAALALGLLARARTEPAAPVTIPGVAASQPAAAVPPAATGMDLSRTNRGLRAHRIRMTPQRAATVGPNLLSVGRRSRFPHIS